MKKILSVIIGMSLLLSGGIVAIAHTATTTIDSIGGIPTTPGNIPIVIPYLPYTLEIIGTVTHEGEGNLNKLELWALDNGIYFFGPARYFKGSGNETTGTYSIPWTITSVGQHVLTIEATHDTASGALGCKAAPAIANSYLKESGSDVSEGKIISQVGQETGKGGSLWAKDKCSNTYSTRTIEFVMDRVTQ
jgi:hypothetical protein